MIEIQITGCYGFYTIRVDASLAARAGDLVVTITIYDNHMERVRRLEVRMKFIFLTFFYVNVLQCGDFVRLQNVHAANYSSEIINLCIHRTVPGGGVFKYSPNDPDVLKLKQYVNILVFMITFFVKEF